MKKLKIDVTKEGLNLIDDRSPPLGFAVRLTPKEAYELIHDIINALADWHRLIGERIDNPKCF